MVIVGTQVAYAAQVMSAARRPVDAGRGAVKVGEKAELAAQYYRVVMQIVVSLAVLGCALVLLFIAGDATQKIASGLIGTVLGYWLR